MATVAPAVKANASTAHKLLRPLQFQPRFQFIGSLHWLCPVCGTIGRAQLTAGSWKVQCGHRGCNRVFAIGYKLLQVPLGRACKPPVDAAFPAAEMASLEPGGRAHEAQLLEPDIP